MIHIPEALCPASLVPVPIAEGVSSLSVLNKHVQYSTVHITGAKKRFFSNYVKCIILNKSYFKFNEP